MLANLEETLEDSDLIERMIEIVTLIDLEMAKFPNQRHSSYVEKLLTLFDETNFIFHYQLNLRKSKMLLVKAKSMTSDTAE